MGERRAADRVGLTAAAFAAVTAAAAGCGGHPLEVRASVPPPVSYQGASPAVGYTGAPSDPVIYECRTGWTPDSEAGTRTPTGWPAGPFYVGTEPSWGAPAPDGSHEYPAWQITVYSNTTQPVGLGNVTIAYYAASGTEMGSEQVSLGGEVLTSGQDATVYGVSGLAVTGAGSCRVVGTNGV